MEIQLSNDFMDIVNKHYEQITDICGNKCIVFMSDTDKSIGEYEKSDIILVFNRYGDMLLKCERVLKKNYSPIKFMLFKITNYFKYRKIKSNKCITIDKDYIDLIEYKAWWWQWAQNLI